MSNSISDVKVVNADPSAIGLFGLAMVTLVASSQKLGITEGLSYVIPWALMLGATAQLLAGIIDFKRNNCFGATAFCGYAFFWYAVALSWLINLGFFGDALKGAVDTNQLAFAFVGYFIFTFFMTIGSLETNKVLLIIFILIDFLFIGLSVSTFIKEGPAHEFFHYFAAISEMLIAIVSFYGFAGNVLNTHFGRVFLPLGKPLGKLKKS